MDVRGADPSAHVVEYLWRMPPAPGAEHAEDGKLACIAAETLTKKFCAWHGGSGRRYVMSVFAVDANVDDAGLPAFDAFVLVAVVRGPTARRVASVRLVERQSDRRGAIAAGLAQGADEWHVHLLAADRHAREAATNDLRSRHVVEPEARCA